MKNCIKAISLILVILLCVVFFIGCGKEISDFEKGLKDAMVSEPYEIYPLVSLKPDDALVCFSVDYTKALFISFEISLNGSTYSFCDTVWCVSEKELSWWLTVDEHEKSVTRLKKLLGFRDDVEIVGLTAFWAETECVFRPSYQPDTEKQLNASDFDLSSLGEYLEWFKSQSQVAFKGNYPFIWTKLGYTYDLATIGNRYGLTQFAIFSFDKIEIVWNKTLEEYLTDFC